MRSSVMLITSPRRATPSKAMSNSWPTFARKTLERCAACSPTSAALSPWDSSAMKRRRVMPLSEDVLDLGKEALALRLILDAGERSEFLQQLALSLIQLRRSLHANFDDQIAFAMSTQDGNTLPLHAQRCPRLRSFRDFQHVVAIQSGDGDLSAERSLRKRDRHDAVEIFALALEK